MSNNTAYDEKYNSESNSLRRYLKNQDVNLSDNKNNERHNVSRENGVAPIQSLQAANLRAALQRAAAKPNGLLIGDQLIRRITGPTAMMVLKPPANPPFYMPPLILFGDVHNSTEGECEACDVGDGCYRISEDAFYQIFDRVSTDEAPIDFYTEFYMKENPTGHYNKNGEIFRTGEYFLRCATWNKLKQQRYRRPSCPTQHIRYQYGDARQADHDEDHGAIFESLLSLMHNDYVYAKIYIISSPNKIIEKIGKLIIHVFNEIGDMYNMKKMPNKERYINKMYELVMNIPSKYSRIRKQLEKKPKGFQSEWIKDIIDISLHPKLDREYLSTWMTNLYTLLRLFKVPTKGSPPPSLAGLYFGYAHTMTMAFFLRNVLGYEIIYHDEVASQQWIHSENNNIDTYSRCILVNKHVDINHLLHASQRQLKHHASLKQKRNASLKKEKKGGSTKKNKRRD